MTTKIDEYNEEFNELQKQKKIEFLLEKLKQQHEEIAEKIKDMVYDYADAERDIMLIHLLNFTGELKSELDFRNLSLLFGEKTPEQVNMKFGEIYKHDADEEETTKEIEPLPNETLADIGRIVKAEIEFKQKEEKKRSPEYALVYLFNHWLKNCGVLELVEDEKTQVKEGDK